MGRAKLKIELIENQKERELAFKRRKPGLIKKFKELIKLCGVDAGMTISIPGQPDVVIPPADPANMIRLYRAKNTADRAKKTDDRARKTQECDGGTQPQFLHLSGCPPLPSDALSGMQPQQSQPRTTPIIPCSDVSPLITSHHLSMDPHRFKNTQEFDPGTPQQFERHSRWSPMPPVSLSGMVPQQSQPQTMPIIPQRLLAQPPLMIPPQHDLAHYSSMDPQWMGAVVTSPDWAQTRSRIGV